MNAIIPTEVNEQQAIAHYRMATNAAGVCGEIVKRTAMQIQNRKYVKVEGWQAIATAHGCIASSRNVERVEGGVRAIGEVRRMDNGAVICEAEGFVGEDETTWFGGEVEKYGQIKKLPKRADYAIRAMAQTRAISRACRSAFAHVVVLIDSSLSTTPAEEVPYGGFDNDGEQEPPREDFNGVANDPQAGDREVLLHFNGKGKPPTKKRVSQCTDDELGKVIELARDRYKKANGKYADKDKAESQADGEAAKVEAAKRTQKSGAVAAAPSEPPTQAATTDTGASSPPENAPVSANLRDGPADTLKTTHLVTYGFLPGKGGKQGAPKKKSVDEMEDAERLEARKLAMAELVPGANEAALGYARGVLELLDKFEAVTAAK